METIPPIYHYSDQELPDSNQELPDPINCDTIIPFWGPSPFSIHAESIFPNISIDGLKQGISDWLQVPPECILLAGNGSSGLIEAIPQVLPQKDSVCAVVQPTYFAFYDSLHSNGIRIARVQSDPFKKFSFDGDLFEKLSQTVEETHAKIIWLCSPNNPTGVVVPYEFIEGLAGNYPSSLIVVDEAYQEMVDPENCQSAVRLIGRHDNVLVTKTFSKAFGQPDIKIGMAVTHPENINLLAGKIVSAGISPKQLSMAATALLDRNQLRVAALEISKEIGYFKNRLLSFSNIQLGSDSSTSFCVLRHRDGEYKLHDLLRRYGVLTVDLDNLDGMEGLRFVRLSLGIREQNLRVLEILKKIDGY